MASVYQVVVTAEAQQNLQEIIKYLGHNVSYETAEQVRDGIEDEIAKLSKHPESKALLRGTGHTETIYRRALKWSYRIVFTVEENELLVLVVRIDNEKMNPASLEDLP
jgi:plasmid stabilization system protein ParE